MKNQDLKKALLRLSQRMVTVFSAPWTEVRIWPTGMNLKRFSTTGRGGYYAMPEELQLIGEDTTLKSTLKPDRTLE